MPRVIYIDVADSTVTANVASINNDGVDSAVCTVRVLDDRGEPVQGLAASECVLAVSGAGNTVTQPTGVTNANGEISGSFVSTGTGTKTVSWTVRGVAITATASVAMIASSVPADFTVDFDADYADIAAVNTDSGSNKTFAAEETGGPWSNFSRQSLPTSIGGKKALRFNYPDRTSFTAANGYPIAGDSLRCADFYIIRALTDFFTDNAPVTECWVEIPFSFSGPLGDPTSAFTTKSPSGWSCVSNADYKWIFLTTNSTRFSWKVGYAGLYYNDADALVAEGPTATQFRWDPTAPGQGDGDNNFIGPNVFDGLKHTLRIYAKVDSVGTAGRQKLWLDGTLLYDSGGINTPTQTQINKLSLGNNLNQGPDRACHVEYYDLKFWINGNDPGWV